MKTNKFLSVDWGTTNLRIRLVNWHNLNISEEITQGHGIKVLYNLWEQANQDREAYYLDYLISHFKLFKSVIDNNIPVVLSGMCSSSIGIRELPYISVPIILDGSGLHTVTLNRKGYKFLIISGVKSDNDVIRGEEVQLIGMVNQLKPLTQNVFIFPGTHSKHIFCKGDTVVDFKTFMTGEIFETLSSYTILQGSIKREILNPQLLSVFEEGVRCSVTGDSLLNSIFRVRTNRLFNRNTPEENYYFLSGLLIGEELSSLKSIQEPHIVLCSSGNLTSLYESALIILDLSNNTQVIDKNKVDLAVVRGQSLIFNTQ